MTSMHQMRAPFPSFLPPPLHASSQGDADWGRMWEEGVAGCLDAPGMGCCLHRGSAQALMLSARFQHFCPMDSKVCLSLLYYHYLLPQYLFGRKVLCFNTIPAVHCQEF